MTENWSIYLIRCKDNSLYTGISNDVEKRFSVHQQGHSSAKYTRSRRPLKLVYQACIGNRSEASKLEYKIKRLQKNKKEALISGSINWKEL